MDFSSILTHLENGEICHVNAQAIFRIGSAIASPVNLSMRPNSQVGLSIRTRKRPPFNGPLAANSKKALEFDASQQIGVLGIGFYAADDRAG
jgi:hypothetical protein